MTYQVTVHAPPCEIDLFLTTRPASVLTPENDRTDLKVPRFNHYHLFIFHRRACNISQTRKNFKENIFSHLFTAWWLDSCCNCYIDRNKAVFREPNQNLDESFLTRATSVRSLLFVTSKRGTFKNYVLQHLCRVQRDTRNIYKCHTTLVKWIVHNIQPFNPQY